MEQEELAGMIREYEAIKQRMEDNIARARKYRDLDDSVHDQAAQAGAKIGELMQMQSQAIRLSEYIDQQIISLTEIRRQIQEWNQELKDNGQG